MTLTSPAPDERTVWSAPTASGCRKRAAALKRRSWKSFKQPKNAVGFGLGLLGAGIGLATGGVPAAAAAAVGSQLVRLLPDRAPESVYSYLFAARRTFH